MVIMNNKFRPWIIFLSAFGLLITLIVVINEFRTPGFCPCYPLLNVPACYMVSVFFTVVLGSQFIKDARTSSVIFFSGTIVGLVTAIWFSTKQILGTGLCPILFGIPIPLCYVAFFVFVALLLLQFKGRVAADSSNLESSV